MLKKRAFIYFVVIAFPMGLGAGASTWLKLPKIHLPDSRTVVSEEVVMQKAEPVTTMCEPSAREATEIRLPDFGAMHPLVVGLFSLLLCSGILLAADEPKSA
jgi:hypothetical protein